MFLSETVIKFNVSLLLMDWIGVVFALMSWCGIVEQKFRSARMTAVLCFCFLSMGAIYAFAVGKYFWAVLPKLAGTMPGSARRQH